MLYTNITQLNVTWRTWWSVHNMHGFYKGKSTQTFYGDIANNMDTGPGISPFSPFPPSAAPQHPGGSTWPTKVHITSTKGLVKRCQPKAGRRTWKRLPDGAKKSRAAQGGTPLAKQGWWTSQSGCGDWTLSKRRVEFVSARRKQQRRKRQFGRKRIRSETSPISTEHIRMTVIWGWYFRHQRICLVVNSIYLEC
jgi:hypothetical protein